MTVYFDNPAGRLHRLITAFQRAASSQPVHGAWAAALVVPGNDLALFLRRLALVVELPAQIEAEIAKVDPDEFDQDAVMRWKGPLDPVLGATLFGQEQSSAVAGRIDSSMLLSLEQCSFVLHRHRRQPEVTDSDIERLRTLLDDLRTEVEHNLDSALELRDFLLHHTRAMTEALDVLVISGRASLEAATDQAVGATIRMAPEMEARGYTRREAWKKFGKLVMAASVIVQLPAATLELPGEIRQLLEGSPTSPAPTVDIHETIVVPDHSTTDNHPVTQHVNSGPAGGNGSKPYVGTPDGPGSSSPPKLPIWNALRADSSASPSGPA